MSDELIGSGWFSRRKFLKAGTMFSILPTLPLAGLRALGEESKVAEFPIRPKDASQPDSPEWTKDLIIYEIATKGFTSPNGPETGTFASLHAKLAYLEELGITGIWLTGYSLCDPHHFYNIWTQYAVIEPDKFDPSLGTAAEFKSLIEEAHHRGIKVFLDVITHGLMNDSPVIQEHPAWFRGGSWGMTDFDWDGGHADLDDWWVKIYTEFVTLYGVDGYRLDVNIYRPDLWERIRRNAAAAGHPIVVWEEGNSAIRGVTDFAQHDNDIGRPENGIAINPFLGNDLPGFFDRKEGRSGDYQVEIRYEDSQSLKGSTKGDGPLGVHLVGLKGDRVGRRWGETAKADGLPDVQIRLENVSRKPIANIIVRSDVGEEWQILRQEWRGRPLFVDAPETLGALVVGPSVDIGLGTLNWGESIELSCHDNGWEGFPLDKSAYVAQGSRSIFGYSFLFSPLIPIFFSGEEFDATFHPLPDLSPHLYGGKEAGKGRWLYGAQLDWNELNEVKHRDMLTDVKKMTAIRRRNSEILACRPAGREPNLKAVKFESDVDVPVPYLRWADKAAIVIAANRNRERDAKLKLKIDLSSLGLNGHDAYVVTDLWSASPGARCTEAELSNYPCTVRRDGALGGGLSVLRIEPARSSS